MAKNKVTFDELIKYRMKKEDTTMVLVSEQKKKERLKLKSSKCFNCRKASHRRVDYWAPGGRAIEKGLQQH
jgi:DNA-directed RNA polymerase subunit M/transcription elongation factor TFIIS